MVSFSLFKDAIDIFVYRHGDPSWLVQKLETYLLIYNILFLVRNKKYLQSFYN